MPKGTWKQEPIWVKRNGDGVAIGFSEEDPALRKEYVGPRRLVLGKKQQAQGGAKS